jgi:hypothetical protein
MSVSSGLKSLRLSSDENTSTGCIPEFIGSSGTFSSACSTDPPQVPADFITFLALAQRLKFPILPTSWQPGRGISVWEAQATSPTGFGNGSVQLRF